MITKERKLLVVDDDEAVRDMLEITFKEAGFSPILAGSAEEAVEILRKENIQILFLDLKLPGISGLELCRKFREYNPVACIYAMTAYTSLFELADCREAGFDDYFIKPVEIDLLVKAAEEASRKIDRWIAKTR